MIDATRAGNLARFINHSCRRAPCCWAGSGNMLIGTCSSACWRLHKASACPCCAHACQLLVLLPESDRHPSLDMRSRRRAQRELQGAHRGVERTAPRVLLRQPGAGARRGAHVRASISRRQLKRSARLQTSTLPINACKLLSSQVAVFRRHVCLQLAAARFVLCMITCGWACVDARAHAGFTRTRYPAGSTTACPARRKPARLSPATAAPPTAAAPCDVDPVAALGAASACNGRPSGATWRWPQAGGASGHRQQ